MLVVSDIQKSYGKRQILRGVSFEAEPGDLVSIVGSNGSGKSTLLRILSGVDPLRHGTISFFGHDAGRDNSVFQKYAGYLPQENPLIPDLSVKENISLWSGKSGRPDEWLVKEFDLAPILGVKAEKLSGGMKRRVSIACAVVCMPPVLFMDEPGASLDLTYKRMIREWMRSYAGRGAIVVIVTHDVLEIAQSTAVYHLEDGVLHLLDEDEKAALTGGTFPGEEGEEGT